MKDAFWTVFRDTGEPMCFILSKAEEREKPPAQALKMPLAVSAEENISAIGEAALGMEGPSAE